MVKTFFYLFKEKIFFWRQDIITSGLAFVMKKPGINAGPIDFRV
jgi:hypothetical protein